MCFGADCFRVSKLHDKCDCDTPGAFAPKHVCSTCDLDRIHACMSGVSEEILDLIAVDSGATASFIRAKNRKLLKGSITSSDVRVIGIEGSAQKARGKGKLVVTLKDVRTGNLYEVDFGYAHLLDKSPIDLLSISQSILLKLKFHFERDNCYLELPDGVRLPLLQSNGLFYLPIPKLQEIASIEQERVPEVQHAHATLRPVTIVDDDEEDVDDNIEEDETSSQPDPFWKAYMISPTPQPMPTLAGHQTYFASDVLAALEETGQHEAYALATFQMWHNRLRHISPPLLRKLHSMGFIRGLDISGNKHERQCDCGICRLAKSKLRGVNKRNAKRPGKPGERVSTDLKVLPIRCIENLKYVIPFIDHYSGHCLVFFASNKKAETIAAIMKTYIKEMKLLGVQVQEISSDRGSEFFRQDSKTLGADDRWAQHALHVFKTTCEEMGVKHVAQPVGEHEHVAESWFSRHSVSVDSMLAHARLSGILAPLAYAYSCFIENRMPCIRHDRFMSPLQIINGTAPDFTHFKTFGCDAYQCEPNDAHAKVPGVVRGRKMIFVGFNSGCKGYALFDPVERRLVSGSTNVVFNENLNDRLDQLRMWDRRRQMLKNKKSMEQQPLQLDDFDIDPADPTSASAVRRLFTDPDEPTLLSDFVDEALDSPGAEGEHAADVDSLEADDVDPEKVDKKPPLSPLHPKKIAAQDGLRALNESNNMRPVRTVRIGKRSQLTLEERRFLRRAQELDTMCVFQTPCPKKGSSPSRTRYLRYMKANTLKQAISLGAKPADILWDFERGWIVFPEVEPIEEGHVIDAMQLCEEHDVKHCVDRYGALCVGKTKTTDYMLAALFEQHDLERRKFLFNDMMQKAFDPDVLPRELDGIFARTKFSEKCARKILCFYSMKLACTGLVTDDFAARGWNLEPEPTNPDMALAKENLEHKKWKEAMDEEVDSFNKFGVYRAVREVEAKRQGKQILTCRWVYKRKVGSDGSVGRYRARLVARGFEQRDGDSYDSDTIHSPVVSKDGLRMMLSLAAGHNMRLHQLDVSAAFLQSELDSPLYMHAPAGFEHYVKPGEILELHKATYGLKQGSSSFFAALRTHLCGTDDKKSRCKNLAAYLSASPTEGYTEKDAKPRGAASMGSGSATGQPPSLGFKSITGDPCIFVRNDSRGKIVVCTYVDDLTYACSNDELAAEFLREMRTRFSIKEGEGAPVSWLLSMAVSQSIEEGYVRISQETYTQAIADKFLTKEEQERGANIRHPMLHSQPLTKCDPSEAVHKSKFDYLSCIGSLLHLVNCTRPDIAYAVGALARFASAPSAKHVEAAKRVCLYCLNTKTLGIQYNRDHTENANIPIVMQNAAHPCDPDKEQGFKIFADSAYADDVSRKSTFGNITFLNGGPISWQSTLAKTVALSTAEAEINSAVEAAKLALHLRLMLAEMTFSKPLPIWIGEDSSSAISQAGSGIRHVRNAKHYECRLRWLQEVISSGDVRFRYVNTELQAADPMTKAMDEQKFTHFRRIMMT